MPIEPLHEVEDNLKILDGEIEADGIPTKK